MHSRPHPGAEHGTPAPLAALFRLVPALLLTLAALPAAAQGNPGPGDWGDAPEGAVAYPTLGVVGLFPTCFGGPAAFVWHGNPGPPLDMYWGQTVDTELDGNAGFCPPPPYERDECWGPFDGDGGLTLPDTYSIAAGAVVPCGQTPPAPLGTPCQMAMVGVDFDANLVNNTPLDGFANVVFDWNQDGRWGGSAACPGGLVSEHAIVNVLVPPGYVGPLSGLVGGAGFQIGPNAGYVWCRLTVSESPVPQNWAGDGFFDLGESEDYLLRIVQQQDEVGEYGDAPEGTFAYPGVVGEFPTCVTVGPAGFVYHAPLDGAYFGPLLDWEIDGNAGVCPQPPYDQDECNGGGGDGGILMPMPITLDPFANPTVCPNGAAGPPLTGCTLLRWGVDIDIEVHNHHPDDRIVNVLADWDGDGKWTASLMTCPNGVTVSEHVLVNFVIPGGFHGPLSALFPPDFTSGMPADGLSWFRFTISDLPVVSPWDGAAQFGDGETEDYLFRVQTPPVDAPELGDADARGLGLRLDSVSPNPMTHAATVRLATGRSGWMRVKVYDAAGRSVATLVDEWRAAGPHELTWNGRDADRREVTPGVYFVRATQAGESVTAKLVRVR